MKPTITFSDFSKLDLLVGTIVKAEAVKGADNLVLLQIDLGDSGKKQLVAGLAKTHKLKELMGKQVVVASNLEEKEIRGKKSEGMLLAADVDGEPILISPEKEVVPGTKVR